MKKSFKLLLVIALCSFSTLSMAQRFEWMKIYSSASFSSVFDQNLETVGNNVIVAGEFRSSISFGSTVLNSGTATSIYIANYDTLGNFRWAVKGGSNSNFERLTDMKVDDQGNIYLMGSFSSSTTWGSLTLNTSGGVFPSGSEGFIVKLNNQGVAQWIRGIYSPNNTFSFNGLVDMSVSDSTLYFTGVLQRTIAVTGSNIQLTQASTSFVNNIYVGKMDLTGTLLSLDKIADGLGNNTANIGDIEAINDSAYYFTSLVRGSYNFGSNSRSYSGSTNYETVVAKFTNANCDWLSFSTNTTGFSSRAPQLDYTANGDVYITGIFSTSLQFQNRTISSSAPNFTQFWYAAKFNNSGSIQELENLGVSGNGVFDIAHNSKNEFFIVGAFRDSVTLNGQKTFSNGVNDMLILGIDTSLSYVWHQTGGGGNNDDISSISSSTGPNIYALGSFRGLSQFGTTYFTGNTTYSTSIVMKLSECGTTQIPLTFNGDTNLCVGQSVRIVANPSSFSTFQWMKDSFQLAGEVYRDLLVDSTGAYQVIVNGAGCKDTSRVVNVHVGTPPTVVYNANDTVCEFDSAIPLSGGTPTGGYYRGVGVSNNTFDPSVAGIGTHPIWYVFSNGGCKDSAAANIFVKPAPTVFFAPLSNVCINSSPITLTNAFPMGGVFSGTAVSGNQFDPAAAGGGFHQITYTYTDANGCVGSSTQTIEVDTLPSVALNPLPTLCANDPLYTLSEGIPAGGYYEGVGVSNNQFDPSVSGAGTFSINYIINNQCGNDTATQSITVNAAPIVSLANFADLCESSAAINLSGGSPAGGNYSGTGVNAGQFDPQVSGVGTFTIYYTYSDGLGCSAMDSSSITVNALPTASLSNDTSICQGSSLTLSAAGGTSYQWSTSATTASINVSPTNTTTYYVTVTNARNCEAVDSVQVSVNSNPTASISGTSTICAGSSTTLSASGGQTYNWSNAVTTANNTVSPSTTTNYTVTVTDANGCSSTASQVVTVNPTPNVSLSSLADLCEGSAAINLSGGSPVGGSYSGIGVNAGQFDPQVSGVGTFTIYYTYADGLGCSAMDSSSITVNALPTVSLSNDTAICQGSSLTLSAAGGTSYQWSTSATTASINVSPTNTTTYYVTVTNASNCQAVDSVQVSVNPNPTASISGTSTICAGSSTTLTASGGQTYSWSNAVTTANNTVSPSTTTNYTVTVTDANGCSSTASQVVTVNPTPNVSLSSLADLCEGSAAINLSGGSPVGGSYSGIGVNAGQFDPQVSGVGTFTIYYTYTDGLGCSAMDSSSISVNALPTVSLTNDTTICAGSSLNLTASGGSSYQWSNAANTATISVSPLTPTTYYVTVSNANNCQRIDSVIVNVDQLPSLTSSNDTSICLGDTVSLSANSNFPNYQWSNAETTASISVSPTQTTQYKIRSYNGQSCYAEDSILVTVNTGTPINIGPDTTLDAIVTTSYTYDAGSGFNSYLWQDNSTNQTFTVNYLASKGGTKDTLSVIVGNNVGCPSVDTAIVTYDILIGIDPVNGETHDVLIYPNPTTEQLNIKFINYLGEDKQLKLYDMKGKLILNELLLPNQEYMQFDGLKNTLSKGIYFIHIQAGEDFYQEKLIIQ